jgi:hypothetical protein
MPSLTQAQRDEILRKLPAALTDAGHEASVRHVWSPNLVLKIGEQDLLVSPERLVQIYRSNDDASSSDDFKGRGFVDQMVQFVLDHLSPPSAASEATPTTKTTERSKKAPKPPGPPPAHGPVMRLGLREKAPRRKTRVHQEN